MFKDFSLRRPLFLVLVLMSVAVCASWFATPTNAQGMSTSEAAARVAEEHGVSPSDVQVTSVTLVRTERVGDLIIEHYQIEAMINGRSVSSGGAPPSSPDLERLFGDTLPSSDWSGPPGEKSDEELIQDSLDFLSNMYMEQMLNGSSDSTQDSGENDAMLSQSDPVTSTSNWESRDSRGNLGSSYSDSEQRSNSRLQVATVFRVLLACLFLASPFAVIMIVLVVRMILVSSRRVTPPPIPASLSESRPSL